MPATLKYIVVDIPFNVRWHLLEVTAAYAGIPLEHPKGFMPDDGHNEKHRKNCHPMQRSPVLMANADTPIFESGSICRHLARLGQANGKALYGSTPLEQSQIDMWIDFALNEMGGPTVPLSLHGVKFAELTNSQVQEKLKGVHEAFAGLELWLGEKRFLVGDKVSVADVVTACYVRLALKWGDKALQDNKKYPNILRHFKAMIAMPEYIAGMAATDNTAGVPEPSL
eukprot:GFUD01038100.1.p2 GENE.GFUD01038100.1~~GFUD01038100.1.p2  ORF type:complete len:226 (+),score=9.72 GFUD01038100.1:44-721(+)